jgi:hypothetical protein
MQSSQFLKIRDKRGTMTRSKRRSTSHVAHVSVPLKGLSRLAQLNEADPLLASILTNWVVEQDRISLRPGYGQVGAIANGTAISTMIPFYGVGQKFIVAAGDGAGGYGLFNATGTRIGTKTYLSDQWQWTSFADLSQKKWTAMVNGHNLVVMWDGTNGSFPSRHADELGIPEADPAGFHEVETRFAEEAGTRAVIPPTYDGTSFDKILSHINRLWFADSHDLAVYYAPIQTNGTDPLTLKILPLNAYFKRGGTIRSIQTWTYTGGTGMDNLLVIFTTNGEAAIYSGSDPDDVNGDFKLVGVYRFDSPMAPGATVNYGGELYVLISTGFVPMSTLLKAEEDNLGTSDQNIIQEFIDVSKSFRDAFGWSVIVNSQTNHAICNMPIGSGKYNQLVRFMPNAVWSKWTDVPARCWAWLGNHAYFSTENGKIYQTGPEYLDDAGKPITVDVRFAWSSFKSVNKKQFKMARLYMMSDSIPKPFVDIDVDYVTSLATNLPDAAVAGAAAGWGAPTVGSVNWDTASWAIDAVPRQYWQGVLGLGRVGAPRIRASMQGCTFALTGVDLIYEEGGLM